MLNRTTLKSWLPGASTGARLDLSPLGLLIMVYLVTGLYALSASAAQVTFDHEPLGTAYGNGHGDVEGDIVLTEEDITMSVELFHSSGATYFDQAIISSAWADFGDDQVLEIHNIGCKFDFTATPDAPGTVAFSYYDGGGTENLQVNGGTILEVTHLSDLNGTSVAPGVTCGVSWTSVGYDEKGTVTLSGPVETVMIGGQELAIDTVSLIGGQGNSSAGCDYEVTHESQVVGMAWGGAHGDAPGDLAFVEDSIPVRLRNFHDGVATAFNECAIEWTPSGFGEANYMHFQSIDVSYETSALGQPVEAVLFQFADMGGLDNMKVNGAPMFVGDLELAPTAIAPSVTFIPVGTIPLPGGGITGMGVLLGDVQHLVLGGEDFYVDNVCVYVDEDGIPCDLLVDFESQTLGTTWGSLYGDSPGDVIFTESGIPVGLDVITYSSGSTNFNEASIDPAPAGCLDDNTISLDNIAATYAIGAAGVPTAAVTFDYYDAGGMQNLQVNGATLYIGDLAAAPAAIAPGVTCQVTTTAMGYDVCGHVTLIGDIQFLLGDGQEFWMDNLCVIAGAAGAAAACDHEVTFEAETLGDAYGVDHGQSPGDIIFTEDDVPVSVEQLYDGSSWVFWNCSIAPAAPSLGVTSGQALSLAAISTVYDFSGLGSPVAEVRFEFVDWAGIENIQVNESPMIYYGQIVDFPEAIAPGITYEVDSWPITAGEAAGRVTLTGNVQSLLVGGQQFMLDNICVVLENGVSAVIPLLEAKPMLQEPFPNPCNPLTTLSFSLPEASPVRLDIYNLAGYRIATLVDEVREAGNQSVVWAGRDDDGKQMPSGIYFARIEAAGRTESRKLMLIK
jgi:hypothetical protein